VKPKILMAVAGEFRDKIFPPHTIRKIEAAGEVIDAPVPTEPTADFLRKHLGKAEIMVSGWGTAALDAPVLSAAPSLKLLAHAAGSIKPQVSPASWDRGIRVTGAAQAIAIGVAEFCLGLIITMSKRVWWMAQRVRQGAFSRAEDFFGPAFEIYGQKIGIIGASFVGRKLLELLKPFDCTVMIYDPYWSKEKLRGIGAEKAETLDEIFKECRVVSLNAPTTKETEKMIKGRHLAMLREGSVFINTARGILIEQDEMVEELRRGRFVACLDVTVPEPLPIDHPLRLLPNVLVTPHEAGAFAENLVRIGEFISEEIERYAAGTPLLGEVTRDRLETIA
jgi:phosphoglycerate dehydrogenase-like enzyme